MAKTAKAGYAHFGKALRRMREQRGLSLSQVGVEVGVTRQYLSMVEIGYYPPPLDWDFLERMRLCLFSGTSVTRLHLLQMAYVCRAPVEIREFLLTAIRDNPMHLVTV